MLDNGHGGQELHSPCYFVCNKMCTLLYVFCHFSSKIIQPLVVEKNVNAIIKKNKIKIHTSFLDVKTTFRCISFAPLPVLPLLKCDLGFYV